MSDNIHHPKHYNSGKIEVIEFIEDQGWGEGFRRGDVIKYVARAGKKDPARELEDLEKAAWYLAREIEVVRAAKENRAPLRPNDMDPRHSLHQQLDQARKTAEKVYGPHGPIFSATDVSTSKPNGVHPGTAATAQTDFSFAGEWVEIEPEDQGKFVVFVPGVQDSAMLRMMIGRSSFIEGRLDPVVESIKIELPPGVAL